VKTPFAFNAALSTVALFRDFSTYRYLQYLQILTRYWQDTYRKKWQNTYRFDSRKSRNLQVYACICRYLSLFWKIPTWYLHYLLILAICQYL